MKKHNKDVLKATLFALIAIFIMIGAAGLLFAEHKKKIQKEQQKKAAIEALERVPTVTPTPAATATPTPEPTATVTPTPVITRAPAFVANDYMGTWYSKDGLVTLSIDDLTLKSVTFTFSQAAFQVGSIITTTGYATTDFNVWPVFSKTILVILMFVGACAGSTGGGIKVSRLLILCKSARKELQLYLHPNAVKKIKMDDKAIPHEVVRATNMFLFVYIMIFVTSLLIISLDNLDMVSNFTAIAATLNNIGPGLGAVGPTGNFDMYSYISKAVMIFDMLAGRLEVFPLLLLFKRDTWRKF